MAVKDRHVILTLGRSGSNSLVDLINHNPEVLNIGEVLGDWNFLRKLQHRLGLFTKSDADYLDFILYNRNFYKGANFVRGLNKRRRRDTENLKKLRQIKNIGIKEFSLNLQRCEVANYLSERPDIKVIGLKRESILDRMISNAMLGATGVVATKSDCKNKPRTVQINPDKIVTLLGNIEQENEILDNMLGALPEGRKIVLEYEHLFSDEASTNKCMSEVFEFLGVADRQVATRMRKLNKQKPSETIEDFEACKQAVKGTRFQHLLEGQ